MRILVVDDDKNIVESLRWLLQKDHHDVRAYTNGEQAVEAVNKETFDMAFCDVVMPGMSGLKVLENVLTVQPNLRVVMISGQSDISTAVNATKLGAYDFLEKPINPEKVVLEVQKIEEQRRVEAEVDNLRTIVDLDYQMIGSSPKMLELRDIIARAAPSDGRILIYGENGSGKELVARDIHKQSGRHGLFLQLNCAALPKELIESELFGYEKGAFTGAHKKKTGLIEEAEGGTLLLDEIGDMAPETQAKVLRVLQENEVTPVGSTKPKKFNVRIISATNKDLTREIEAGHFREDLYFRLNVVPITVPPLRERRQDIPELVHHFLNVYAVKNGKRPKKLQHEAVELLKEHSWPGNIRELKNIVERLGIMISGEEITASDVESLVSTSAKMHKQNNISPNDGHRSLKEQINGFEHTILRKTFDTCDGNVSRMANMLRTDRANLHKKLRKYGIK